MIELLLVALGVSPFVCFVFAMGALEDLRREDERLSREDERLELEFYRDMGWEVPQKTEATQA